MTAPVLWIADRGTIEVHYYLLVGNRLFATIAHNLDIFGLQLSLVVTLGSGWMVQGGRTGESMEMVVAKTANYTTVVDEID